MYEWHYLYPYWEVHDLGCIVLYVVDRTFQACRILIPWFDLGGYGLGITKTNRVLTCSGLPAQAANKHFPVKGDEKRKRIGYLLYIFYFDLFSNLTNPWWTLAHSLIVHTHHSIVYGYTIYTCMQLPYTHTQTAKALGSADRSLTENTIPFLTRTTHTQNHVWFYDIKLTQDRWGFLHVLLMIVNFRPFWYWVVLCW